ncbi:MAG: hypothetical protein BWY77_01884 [bacterium ADurb.Bin431]|nr:MAG: hypothetical protein BWY77_01884 [bacterium ADurb.Bin431]
MGWWFIPGPNRSGTPAGACSSSSLSTIPSTAPFATRPANACSRTIPSNTAPPTAAWWRRSGCVRPRIWGAASCSTATAASSAPAACAFSRMSSANPTLSSRTAATTVISPFFPAAASPTKCRATSLRSARSAASSTRIFSSTPASGTSSAPAASARVVAAAAIFISSTRRTRSTVSARARTRRSIGSGSATTAVISIMPLKISTA